MRVVESFELPTLQLTEWELEALALGVDVVSSWAGPALSEASASVFTGFEFALFKLKEGASEAQLLGLSRTVEDQFLVGESGLLSHFLLKGKDGQCADVTIATAQERAKEICREWLGNDTAQQYLELLEPGSSGQDLLEVSV